MARTAPATKLARIQALLDGATTKGERVAAFRAKERVIARHFLDKAHPILLATTVEELHTALRNTWDFNENTSAMDSATLGVYLSRVDHTLLVSTHKYMHDLHGSWWTNGRYTGPEIKRNEWDRNPVSPLKFHSCVEWKVSMAIKNAA